MERAIIHLPEVLLSVGLIVLMLKIHLTQRSTSTFAEVVDFEQSENALVGFGDYAGRVQVVNNPKVVFSDHNGRSRKRSLAQYQVLVPYIAVITYKISIAHACLQKTMPSW